jgi:ABC-2 type transport system ATP-binding protein
VIRCRGLTRTFGTVSAVRSLDLEVSRGHLLALVGPDGAGKTTLLRMLTCAIAPSDGEAQVAGFDVRADPESVKARIGYMPQRFSLYGDLSVDENISFFAALHGVPESSSRERADRLLEQFRLAPFRARLTRDLSGGMKQKAALACTLIHEPEALFLDEPTAGVDPVSRRQFWRILHELNRPTRAAGRMTVVVSTPYMDEAERASEVALIHHGRIVACAPPDALRARVGSPIYEVVAEPKREAGQRLAAHPLVLRLEIFGEAWHVVGAREGMEAALREALGDRIAVRVIRRIPPSLEDVFIALLGPAS